MALENNEYYKRAVWRARERAAQEQTRRNLERLAREGRISEVQRGLHRCSPTTR